jgi:hypothetical protein
VQTLKVTNVRTLRKRCVIEGFNSIKYTLFISDMTDIKIEGTILKHSCKVERLIVHIRGDVA